MSISASNYAALAQQCINAANSNQQPPSDISTSLVAYSDFTRLLSSLVAMLPVKDPKTVKVQRLLHMASTIKSFFDIITDEEKERSQREETFLLRCNGFVIMCLSSQLISHGLPVIFSNDLEFDCRGISTIVPGGVHFSMGEIKNRPSEAALQHAVKQLFTRFAILHQACKVIHQSATQFGIKFTGSIFVPYFVKQERRQNQLVVDQEVEKYRQAAANINFTIGCEVL